MPEGNIFFKCKKKIKIVKLVKLSSGNGKKIEIKICFFNEK
jgi:hypothetical protein